MALFSELRRRNVFKVVLLYAIASWLIVWLEGEIHDHITLPAWTNVFTLTILALGFPVALWFAWTYEITPVGLKKAVDVDQTQSIVYKTGQKLNAAVAVLLTLGVLAVFGQRLLPDFVFPFVGGPEGDAPALDATPDEIRKLVLDNGLRIVVWPDPAAGGVLLYNLAHAARADGICVGAHVTAFGARFPAEALEAVVGVEVTRLQNLEPDLAVATTEFGANFFEQRVYTDTRNRFPIYGRPSGRERCTERALISYYQSFFAPNESTVIVMGNVDPDDVFALFEDLAGPLPARKSSPFEPVEIPSHSGVRRTVVDPAVGATTLQLSFHAARHASYEQLPMALLLYVLVGSEESRLQRGLIDGAGVATHVDGHMVAATGPTVVHFELELPQRGNVAKAEQATLDALQLLIDEGISEEELVAARAVILEDLEQSLETGAARAIALGLYEIFSGDYEALFAVPVELQSISTSDLQQLAGMLFVETNLSVGIIQPR